MSKPDGEKMQILPDGRVVPIMTLRDYFAAKAMQSSIACGATSGTAIADSAYRFADAMLAERKK